MRIVVALAVVAMVAAVQASAAQARSTEYRKWKMFYPGYTDRPLASDRWQVTGTSLGGAAGKALPVALYRAALLLKRAGYSHMQPVRSTLEVQQYGMGATQYVKLQVVGLRPTDPARPCENKKRNLHLCQRSAIEDVIAAMAAELGQSPAEVAEDYAAVTSG